MLMKKNVFILFTILLFLASCNNDSDNIMSKEKNSIEFAHLDILKKISTRLHGTLLKKIFFYI